MYGRPRVLGFDANCAIYDCVTALSGRIPYKRENHTMWEAQLIKDTIHYFEKIIKAVHPSEAVWIAFDGVAPMAKIRQQRGRRFKSAKDRDPSKEEWDTNAITPGTVFMANLAKECHSWSKQSKFPIRVSATDEPGEGEQKLMTWCRDAPPRHITIYGLDADLIILALLHSSDTLIDLYREELAFGKKSPEKNYLYFSINLLAKELSTKWNISMDEFAAVMNLLGNDFVPHGMGLKIREEGMEHVLQTYQTIRTTYPPIVSGHTYTTSTLRALLKELSLKEIVWMTEIAADKLSSRPGQRCSSSDPVEYAKAIENDAPIVWAAEKAILEQKEEYWYLRSDYKEGYQRVGLWGTSYKHVGVKYLEALAWCFAYYKGVKVDMNWYYPWWIAPLLDTVIVPDTLEIPLTERVVLQPTDQLAMVLPIQSYHLLPTAYQAFPKMHPELFPVSWSLYSFGRRFRWECEPMIPLVLPTTLQVWKRTS